MVAMANLDPRVNKEERIDSKEETTKCFLGD